MCLMQKTCILGKLCLGLSYSAVDCEFNVNEKCIINNLSLSRNGPKTRPYIDCLMKRCPKIFSNLILYFP